MSGHSKWSTIKRKKAANDAKRGAIFTRLAREIAIAAREGGDPDVNFALRLAIDRAKAENMPKDNIERAIRRGTGEDKDAARLEQILYEGYGPHGVALLIEVVTDNRNRTVAELRHTLTDAGGNMADAGSVAWQFHRAGYFYYETEKVDPDAVFEIAVDAGAEDVILGDEEIEVFTPADLFKTVNDALRAAGLKPDEAELRMVPNSTLELSVDKSVKTMRLIERIEDLDDVQNVYSNLAVTDDALELLEAA
ncbi:MAG: YebC/PmpR family DNA-binding transcriptional regulator [Anaerolineales bacterium]|jgi:YebC/PmpR family DNA-binding regulatory protein